ncbi:putative biotin synthase [Mycobacterium xenopi 4042]|uniref:Putative biotin synthase n=1 Tax=Mycobacterium xenopi 4042 TaxID=1299334 RepID=X7Z003_MYCXE|nr:putative biotin synthase [Mycobacterium xenopi 4042]
MARASRRSATRSTSISPARWDAQRRAGEATGGDGCAPLPQPGDGPLVLSPRRHTHTWEERWNTLSMVREAAWRCVAAASSAWAKHCSTRRIRRGARRTRSGRGAAELPQPRRAPLRRLGGNAASEALKAVAPFGWHYRAPCSDSRAP